jgi:hypothetical protein
MQTRSQSRGVQKPVIRRALKMPEAVLQDLLDRGVVRQYQGAFILTADEDADGRARFEAAIDAENRMTPAEKEARVRAALAELVGDARRLLLGRSGVELGWEALGDVHAVTLDGAEVRVDFGGYVREWAQEAYDECELRGKMQMPVFRAIGAASLRALKPDAVVEVTVNGVNVTLVPGGAKEELAFTPIRLVFGAELLVALEAQAGKANSIVMWVFK